jgi:lipoprotein-anchoring transpeptidase ErfK/SrfK
LSLSRRGFLKLASLGLGGLALRPLERLFRLPDFPQADRLGRANVGMVDLKARPDADSQTQKTLYEDSVVPRIREVVGTNPYRTSQRYVETPEGYIWAPHLQPVLNQPNSPLQSLPENSQDRGMWVEVTVPYVDLILDNPPARSPWTEYRVDTGFTPRLYFSQVAWIDDLRIIDSGHVLYRVNEKFGTYGDIFWADAQAFRPITAQEIAPINPDAEDKRVVVDVNAQTMTCFEGSSEVFYTRISSGAKWNAEGNVVDVWETPVGKFPIWRKLISLHMSGGTTGGGWDLPGIGWVSLFVGSGVAVHATYWHNNFGEPMSNGCVNARPEDAKWVFRWTQPAVNLDPGDAQVSMPGGTIVEVVEV